jgi:phosphatidylglycerophosphatase A
MSRLAVLVATAGGAGYTPVAPGTAGSLVGVAIFLVTADWTTAGRLVLLAAVVAAGVWSGGRAAALVARKDPGHVVIDEVAGQLLTLYFTGVNLLGAALGFLLFRALDIVKPWPARRLETLPGGAGIMADDLMAGLYGHLILLLLVRMLPEWLG